MFIYPENLKAQPTLFFWQLKDLFIIGILLIISAFTFTQTGFTVPIAATAAYAFLCVRIEDTSVKDFIGYAINYFFAQQQEYNWRLGINEKG